MNLVLLGPPGAGKGTQSARIAERYKWPHLASGDILRGEVKANSELGRKAQEYMNSGNLVPDDLILSMMAERITRPEANNGFVLDGFPRTLAQARGLDERLKKVGRKIDRVFHIKVDRSALIARLSGRWYCPTDNSVYHITNSPPKKTGVCDLCGGALAQRPDDRASVVTKRLETYEDQTAPLVGYYRDLGLLTVIDGGRDVAEVSSELDSFCRAGV